MMSRLTYLKMGRLYRQIYMDLIKFISKEMDGINSFFIGETSMMLHNSIDVYLNNNSIKPQLHLPRVSIFCSKKEDNLIMKNKINNYMNRLYLKNIVINDSIESTQDFVNLINKNGVDAILMNEFLKIDINPSLFYKETQSISLKGDVKGVHSKIIKQIEDNKLLISGLNMTLRLSEIAKESDILKNSGVYSDNIYLNIVSSNIDQDGSEIIFKKFQDAKIPYKNPCNIMEKSLALNSIRLSNYVNFYTDDFTDNDMDEKIMSSSRFFKQKFKYITNGYPFYKIQKNIFSQE